MNKSHLHWLDLSWSQRLVCGIFFHCVSGIQVLPPWLSHAWFLKFFLMLILCLLVLSATLIQDHYSTHLHLPHYTPLTCFSAQSLLWKHLKHITSPLAALLLASRSLKWLDYLPPSPRHTLTLPRTLVPSILQLSITSPQLTFCLYTLFCINTPPPIFQVFQCMRLSIQSHVPVIPPNASGSNTRTGRVTGTTNKLI